ncbi:branched-chain amino acid transport family protein [Clostridium sporogenes]|uniref:Branched-chain amino acid transport system carrier protein n=1 Tax=Clostridium sporogenes TaxID=1509 RepID=A0A1L3NG90_CLOSG|nr:branched-chain amino acid transport family protein [Clostridium sporogenes]
MILANMGLTKILSISVPILNAIYPISIMLIVLAMLDNLFKESSIVYGLTILFTGVVSVVDALGQVGIKLSLVTDLCNSLPLYSKGLPWVVPAVFGMILGVISKIIKERVLYLNFTPKSDV